jgi:hypothetical protein
MRRALTIAQWIVRLTGPTQVVLGLLFWTNHARALLPLHMAVGVAFVLGVWTHAAVAWRAGLRAAPTLLVVAWGAVVALFGMTHARLLPGPRHWIVQLLHLLVGVVAMLVAMRVAAFVRRRLGEATRRTGPVSDEAPASLVR